jgi:tetratricopeptide (TPR) repeat protein
LVTYFVEADMSLTRALFAAVLALAVCLPAMAEAQERDADARRIFEAAQVLYEDGEFQQAGRMFERAYEFSQRTSLLYNAYLAYRDAQMQADAARTLRLYLDRPDAQDRERLTPRLAALERANAAGTATPPNLGDAPPPDGVPVDRVAASGSSDESVTPVETDEDDPSPNLAGPLLVSAGGAALAVGVVMGVLATNDADALGDRCVDFVCSPDARSLRDRSQRRGNASTALLVGGGVSAVAGVILWFVLRDHDEEPARARLDVGCTGQGCSAAVRGSF